MKNKRRLPGTKHMFFVLFLFFFLCWRYIQFITLKSSKKKESHWDWKNSAKKKKRHVFQLENTKV